MSMKDKIWCTKIIQIGPRILKYYLIKKKEETEIKCILKNICLIKENKITTKKYLPFPKNTDGVNVEMVKQIKKIKRKILDKQM